MRGLVVLRCGRNSLHWDWLDARRDNWDLLLCPYQPIDGRGHQDEVFPGQKWDGLSRYFATHQQWRDYDYICLPDDDIATDAASLNRLFTLCEGLKISLAAPALTPESYFSHPITMRNTQFAARRTSFVEIMMPCFSRAFFEQVLPTLELSRSGTGFGLDYLWPHMLSYQDIWLFDDLPVHHTRPVGAMRKDRLAALANADLHYVHGFGIPALLKTFGGVGYDGTVQRCDDAGFAQRYRSGYAYLAPRMADLERHIDSDLASAAPAATPLRRDYVRFALAHLAQADRTISRGRPSLTSSTSQWSWCLDPELEASGANDGRLNGCCGFHTSYELNPWWQVDLGAPHSIESVVIYNRLDQKLRCVDFDLLVSDDARSFRVAFAKRDGIPFGGADGEPFRHDFVPATTGRFLRVQLAGTNFLHLDQVEVFGTALKTPTIIAELLTELYGGANPLSMGNPDDRDDGYPPPRLVPEVVDSVLDVLRPAFWLEIGSLLGGSAIRTAERIKQHGLECGLVCLDPFCGDVDMWAAEQPQRRAGGRQALGLRNGRPTLFERFVANVVAAGHADITLPIAMTATLGTRLLARLLAEGRISAAPGVIYLNAAHEPEETWPLLRSCWSLLPAGAVLMGNAWDRSAVREELLRLRKTAAPNEALNERLAARHGKFAHHEGVLLDQDQWLLVK